MKRLLLVLVVLCLLVDPGSASLNFQKSSDQNSVVIGFTNGTSTVMSWVDSATGQNSYQYMNTPSGSAGVFRNINPNPTSYTAGTLISQSGANKAAIYLYDSSGNTLWYSPTDICPATGKRAEIQITGGIARLYCNGTLVSTSGVLSVNPSYIGYGNGYNGYTGGASYWDDIVYSDTDNKYIFGNPKPNAYTLKKDMVSPSSSGFYDYSGSLINSNNFTTTWAKSNITYTGNQTVVLENVDTGTIYGTRYTNTASYGTVSWALADEIFNSGAPYGRYYVTIPGTGAYSEEIWYLGSGATINFDKSVYAGQDTATMTYTVDGAYWDTSTYSYTIDVISGTTGATMQSTAISASSGTDTYTFTSTDPLGVYYAIVKATKHSDGSVIWMNYDYAELTSYVTIQGYINDAETGLPINNAHINITQSSIINNLTTIADGNYSATYYLSGTPIAINATEAAHRQYTYSFTPLNAKTIELNVSLVATTPSVVGLGIGGVARDVAYGRPLPLVSVWVVNTSNAESYTKTTSMTGWYLCDEGTACILATKRPYDMWGSKPGYNNSANYTAVTA